MVAIGLDGFRGGWVAVTIDGDRRGIDFPSDISWLVTQGFSRAAIDIPIGMTENGERVCDSEARRKLSPHGSRVFSGARRWLWKEFSDPSCANKEAERRGETKVSRQLWHLGPKIMQVDEFMSRYPKLVILESHPELVFLRLNGDVPLASKHTLEGLCLRRALLIDQGFSEIDEWLEVTRRKHGNGAKRDDILDACAVALAAQDAQNCVPQRDEAFDAHNLPMRIWF